MAAMVGETGRDRGLLEDRREAGERFVRDYRLLVFKAVHAAARRFGAGADDVEDAVQQVFVELFADEARVLKSFAGRSTFAHWLTVVAYRIAVREFGRRGRERGLEEEGVAPARPSDPEILERVSRLPERERRALLLFHVEGQGYREISRVLGIPLEQVGMVLLRARERLAGMLGGEAP